MERWLARLFWWRWRTAVLREMAEARMEAVWTAQERAVWPEIPYPLPPA